MLQDEELIELRRDPPPVDLLSEMEAVEAEEAEVRRRLEALEIFYRSRRKPLELHSVSLQEQRLERLAEIEEEHNPRGNDDNDLPPPGPTRLRWVDGACFTTACTCVIVANLGTMYLQMRDTKQLDTEIFAICDNVFLAWYVVELGLKMILHRHYLFCGKITVVWWNWLDSMIVLSGILDQWIAPFLKAEDSGSNFSALRSLRLLRLFRIARALKIARIFLQSDLSWTEGFYFQTLVIVVITVNSITVWLELDYPWSGWYWVEQVFLVIYVFELAVRLKRWGIGFFCHEQDLWWNNLDFIIVASGVMDQWTMPCINLVQTVLLGAATKSGHSSFGRLMMLLRMMRLLRVLRLIRLVRSFRPLYNLLLGILESLQGVQWVLLLATLTLYAAGIVFANLLGHGILSGGQHSQLVKDNFGTVPNSMFTLFKMMNGDQSVVGELVESETVQCLFIMFMVASNWILLSIVTAVLCDQMISSHDHTKGEDEKEEIEQADKEKMDRLGRLLQKIDANGDGALSQDEFKDMLNDASLREELMEASGLALHDLQDMFLFLSHEDSETGERVVHSGDFFGKLQLEGKKVSERSIFRLEKRMRLMEQRLALRLEQAGRMLEARME